MKSLGVRKIINNRIDQCFTELNALGRTAFLPYITAGDPDFETSKRILLGLPAAGADLIEIGMPFSDPMADGSIIQASSVRALKSGQTMNKTIDLVRRFRKSDSKTPIILMGYYNPVYVYGVNRFVSDIKKAGVDGIIIVDLPHDADCELYAPAMNEGLSLIRLVTPTTDHARLQNIIQHTTGFIYYVSITGVTGSELTNMEEVAANVKRIRSASALPIGIGFGIKTHVQVAEISRYADAVIAGSVLINKIAGTLDENGKSTNKTVCSVLNLVSKLSLPLKLKV
ncbi:MAG TPA: Tryptophan synthase alpha chain [Hyphomicrobiaceae bacterium MAG_BT-2024]